MTAKLFSQIISVIFNPLIISLLAFYLLIFGIHPVVDNANLVFLVCFIFSNFLPIVTVLLLKKYGKISDLDASQREQRIFPLSLGLFYSAVALIILNQLHAGMIVRGLMFCYMINTAVTLFITRYWKISVHALGVSAPITALHLAGFQFAIPATIVIISVGYSRIVLKAHNLMQVTMGTILGILLTWLQLKVLFI